VKINLWLSLGFIDIVPSRILETNA
jgi:hypothetical protein